MVRRATLDSTVADLFRGWPRTSESDLVFTNAAGGRLGWLQHGFRNALARAGLTDLHFHDLRHTFASQWMMAGGDLYVLKSILGHKSVAMTQRYAHLSPSYKKAMVERMEQIWAKPAGKPVGRSRSRTARTPSRNSDDTGQAAVAQRW